MYFYDFNAFLDGFRKRYVQKDLIVLREWYFRVALTACKMFLLFQKQKCSEDF